ncbi:hypothetical protein BDY21DRAFT_382600 [Lineolata rhizophorae]|uniref:Uncharacterized protein n=1 Tax=Lineolata rhizophorae TaxID=578093 RepID=A0A6A6NMQ5_9PEZI|nr:hypothetical protein BDY21DRAFT_382600 [Lineolata rhizophorae]
MRRQVSAGVSFWAAIIQDDRTAPEFSCDKSMSLIKSTLGDAGHVDGITIMPLALNSWLLTGFLHALHHAAGSTATQMATQATSVSSDSEGESADDSESDSERATHTSSDDDDDSSDGDVDPTHDGGHFLDDADAGRSADALAQVARMSVGDPFLDQTVQSYNV